MLAMNTENDTPLATAPVNIAVKVTADDVECIVCDGSMFGSWWGRLRVREDYTVRAIVADPDDDTRWKGYCITPQQIAEAIAALIANGFDTHYPSGALAEFAVTGEFGGGYDSVVADAILQQAMFGEVIYG